MHSVVKHLNRKQVHYCRNCVISAINKVKDGVVNEDEDICREITRTETLENDIIVKLHKLTSIVEESNNLS